MAKSLEIPGQTLHEVADGIITAMNQLNYLDTCRRELRTDPVFIREVLSALILSNNTTALAEQVGMSRMGLRKAFGPAGNPSFATVLKVIPALGLALELRLQDF